MSLPGDGKDIARCSFCGKTHQQVAKLIAGPAVYICDECVGLCRDIIANESTGQQTGSTAVAEDRQRWSEANQALSARLHRRPTVSELAVELGWDEERVTAAGRGEWVVTSGPMTAGVQPPVADEVRQVRRDLDHLARRVAALADQTEGSQGGEPGPRRLTPVFPDAPPVVDAPPEHRVQLRYDHGDNWLHGSACGQPVELDLVRHSNVSGRIGGHGLAASWATGDNYVPEPGGWTPTPDFVSDFPNIPADLTGSFAGQPAELHGVFHLDAEYRFERGSIAGRIGAVHLEATAQAASGGFSDSRTVVVDGTFGPTPFEIYASIDGGLTRGTVHGTVEGTTVHLDITPRGPTIDVSGTYQGPPELLAIMVGTVLQFL